MNRKIKGSGITLEFTPSELLEYARGIKNAKSHAINDYMDSDFCPYSWEKTLDTLATGWHDGVAKMDVSCRALEAREGLGPQVELVSGVTGDFFDVGILLSGDPEGCFSFEEQETPRSEITVWVSLSASCMVDQQYIFNRGAVICNLIDKLKKEYFVKVIFQFGGKGNYSNKKYQDVLCEVTMDTQNGYSRSLLAFMSAHPGVLRRLYFAASEYENGQNNCNGYGMPYGDISRPEPGDVVFAPIDSGYEFKTIESSLREIERIMSNRKEPVPG